MICIYTADDSSWCTCGVCKNRRGEGGLRFDDINDLLRQIRQQATAPQRRRPCPTGIRGSLDGVVPYQPSRCATYCTCCSWCRGDESPSPAWCTCPTWAIPESNCERGHSGLVECRGGCKPRTVAPAIVVQRSSWLARMWRWLFPVKRTDATR